METLTPTARIIAQIAMDAYKAAGGIGANNIDELSKAQVAGFNAVAEWHEQDIYPVLRKLAMAGLMDDV